MARRAEPARIDDAHREGTRQRLLSTGMLPERVDAMVAAWEVEATRRKLPPGDRMNGAWEWITARAARPTPASR